MKINGIVDRGMLGAKTRKVENKKNFLFSPGGEKKKNKLWATKSYDLVLPPQPILSSSHGSILICHPFSKGQRQQNPNVSVIKIVLDFRCLRTLLLKVCS